MFASSFLLQFQHCFRDDDNKNNYSAFFELPDLSNGVSFLQSVIFANVNKHSSMPMYGNHWVLLGWVGLRLEKNFGFGFGLGHDRKKLGWFGAINPTQSPPWRVSVVFYQNVTILVSTIC